MNDELIDIEDYEKTLTWNYYNTSAFTDFKEIYKEAKLTKKEWQALWLSVGTNFVIRSMQNLMEEKYGTNSNHIS